MPVTFVTGSFLPGRFVPNPTQEHVDSGLPEWTLGADGTPPAEPTEHDGDDAEISDDEDNAEDQAEEGYDADDEDDSDSDDGDSDVDNDNDLDEYAEDYEHFLSTLPAGNPSTLEETVDDGTSADDSYIEDYEDFLSTIEVGSSSMLGDTSSSAQPPSLETDSGTWTASSDAAATESDGSDEAFNAQVDAEVVIRRPSTPDLSGLTLNARASRHRPRSRTQIPGPAFEIHTDSDNPESEPEEEQPPLWESARPTGPFHIITHHITLSHDTAPHRVHLPPMTPLPERFSSYSEYDRGLIATIDLHRIIEQHVPRDVNLFLLNSNAEELDALLEDALTRIQARRRAMGEFVPGRTVLGQVGERDYRRNDADASLVGWVQDVRALMEREDLRGQVAFNRTMWGEGGYESDENDLPDV
jgi:hypothetical protein